MKVDQGVKIVCDGTVLQDDGERVACGVELHPQTNAIVSKTGVLGHHCDWCHDPDETANMAIALGYSQEELRGRFPTKRAAVVELAGRTKKKADDDAANASAKKLAADAAAAKKTADDAAAAAADAAAKAADAAAAADDKAAGDGDETDAVAAAAAPAKPKNGKPAKVWP